MSASHTRTNISYMYDIHEECFINKLMFRPKNKPATTEYKKLTPILVSSVVKS